MVNWTPMVSAQRAALYITVQGMSAKLLIVSQPYPLVDDLSSGRNAPASVTVHNIMINTSLHCHPTCIMLHSIT